MVCGQIPACCGARRFALMELEQETPPSQCKSHWNQSLRGHEDFPRYYPPAELAGEGSTDMSWKCTGTNRFVPGQVLSYPTRNFAQFCCSIQTEWGLSISVNLSASLQSSDYITSDWI